MEAGHPYLPELPLHPLQVVSNLIDHVPHYLLSIETLLNLGVLLHSAPNSTSRSHCLILGGWSLLCSTVLHHFHPTFLLLPLGVLIPTFGTIEKIGQAAPGAFFPKAKIQLAP